MIQYNWALKIILPDSYGNDSTIGLYDNHFAWVESVVPGLSGYTAGVINAEGFGAIKESWDSENGGGSAVCHDTKVSINNCEQLIHTINDTPIYILGQPAYIYEIGYDTDSTAITETIIFSGICESPSWNETELIIPIRDANLKRRANIGTISNDAIVPVTFGEFQKSAKAVRTEYEETIISNSWHSGIYTPAGTKYFPCVAKQNFGSYPLQYSFKLSSGSASTSTGWSNPEDPTFCEITEGHGKGQIRKVDNWQLTASNNLNVILGEVFDGTLAISGLNQSWAKFYNRSAEYKIDSWPCEGFVNDNGVVIKKNAQIYSFDSESKQYARLPDYGIDIATDSTNNNKLVMDGRQSGESIDIINGYVVLPITTLTPSIEPLSAWYPDYYYTKYAGVAGLYSGRVSAGASYSDSSQGAEYDKSILTARILKYTIPNVIVSGAAYIIILEATLPPFPEGIDFDEVYLWAKIAINYDETLKSVTPPDESLPVMLKMKRFFGDPKYISGSSSQMTVQGYGKNILIDNIPDFYYSDATSESTEYNTNYHIDNNSSANVDSPWKLTGQTAFKIDGVESKEKYESIQKIALIFQRMGYTPGDEGEEDPGSIVTITDVISVTGLSIAFKKSADVPEEIYTSAKGRVQKTSFIPPVVVPGSDGWEQVAGQLNSQGYIYSLVVLGDQLYGSTGNNGRLFRWNGTDAWEEVAGQLDDNGVISNLVVLNSEIYGIGAQGKLLKWNSSNAWVQVAQPYSEYLSNVHYMNRLVVFNGNLYTTSSHYVLTEQYGGKLFRWNGSNAWEQVAAALGSHSYAAVVFDGAIYGTSQGKLFRWNGTDAWVQVAPALSPANNLLVTCVYDGAIYALPGNNSYLYRWNGTDAWEQVVPSIGGYDLTKMAVFNNELYAGHYYGRLFKLNSGTWEQVAVPLNSQYIESLCVYSNNLYAGTAGGRLFRYRLPTTTTFPVSSSAMLFPDRIIEHVARLQNWSETGEAMPAEGWGRDYASTAKIDDSTNRGGFYHTDIESSQNSFVRRQVLSENETWTDAVIEGLARECFLLSTRKNFADSTSQAGLEQVYFLMDDTTATDSVTLADIVGPIGDVQEPRPENIYCEPLIKYCYDEGRGDFTKIIQVKNVSADTWQSSYTEGFIAGHGEDIWNRCHALWLKYRHIEPVPSDKSELQWIYYYDSAIAYLDRWLRWMQLKRISFSVSYSKGRAWHIGKKIDITLPHQLDGQTQEALIDECEKDKNTGLVSVRVVLLDDSVVEEYFIQDVYQDGVTEQWQDDLSSSEINDRM